VTFVDIDDID